VLIRSAISRISKWIVISECDTIILIEEPLLKGKKKGCPRDIIRTAV
jgi:hypothetical protein